MLISKGMRHPARAVGLVGCLSGKRMGTVVKSRFDIEPPRAVGIDYRRADGVSGVVDGQDIAGMPAADDRGRGIVRASAIRHGVDTRQSDTVTEIVQDIG